MVSYQWVDHLMVMVDIITFISLILTFFIGSHYLEFHTQQ